MVQRDSGIGGAIIKAVKNVLAMLELRLDFYKGRAERDPFRGPAAKDR